MLSALLNSPPLSFMDEVTRLCRELGDFSIPEGYQDESGFHYVSVHTLSRAPMEEPISLGEHI